MIAATLLKLFFAIQSIKMKINYTKIIITVLLLLQSIFLCSTSSAQQASPLEENTTVTETLFERGSRIIFQDNFEKDAIGDFPAKWNTSKSGEVKKLTGFDSKFLKINDGAVVNVQLTKPLPVNFTAEFDLIVPNDIPMRYASFGFGSKPIKIDWLLAPKEAVVFSLHSNQKRFSEGLKFGTQKFSSADFKLKTLDFKTPLNQPIKIAISVNNKRIRLYADGIKIVDMPTSFDASFRKSFFFNATTHGAAESKLNYFYIGNVVLSEAGTDRRSKVLKDLMESGSFSTNAILFAANSDKIQVSSNEIIQEIAEALKESKELKLQIIGHTDNDGDDAKNLLLSKKRAAAVKAKSVSMGIAAIRLTTNGKGEKEPVAGNDTEEGKAANRRVQFIKL